jgi:hypothetical protein
MLNSLRKAVGLAGSETPHTTYPDVPGDQAGNNAAVAKKGRELARGRTRAKVEELKGLLASARKLAVEKNQVAGQIVVDGDDASMAISEAQHAENNVKILEAALAVSIQKDEAAQRELATAQQAAALEAKRQIVARVKALAAEMDARLADNARFVDGQLLPSIDAALEELRAGAKSMSEISWLTDVRQGIGAHVLMAFSSVISDGRALKPFLGKKSLADRCPE